MNQINDHDFNLLALKDFNQVAAHGGFSKASRASGRPKATLSRHVMELEEVMGVRLLERSGRSFRLTEEGKALYLRTEGLMSEIKDVLQDVLSGQGKVQGKLRISSPVTFGQLSMGRIAGEFCKQFPDVHMEVTIEDRKVDLVEEGYDVVIRVNPDPDSDLVGRCFYRDHLLVVAPPSLARPIQSTDSHSNASIPAVVGITMPEFAQWAVSDGANVYRFQRHAVMKLSSPLMIRDAVLAGAGAAILGQKHVKKDIAEGRLVSWGVVPNQAIELWVLHTSRRLVSPKVSAFVTFLYETHRDYRE